MPDLDTLNVQVEPPHSYLDRLSKIEESLLEIGLHVGTPSSQVVPEMAFVPTDRLLVIPETYGVVLLGRGNGENKTVEQDLPWDKANFEQTVCEALSYALFLLSRDQLGEGYLRARLAMNRTIYERSEQLGRAIAQYTKELLVLHDFLNPEDVELAGSAKLRKYPEWGLHAVSSKQRYWVSPSRDPYQMVVALSEQLSLYHLSMLDFVKRQGQDRVRIFLSGNHPSHDDKQHTLAPEPSV